MSGVFGFGGGVFGFGGGHFGGPYDSTAEGMFYVYCIYKHACGLCVCVFICICISTYRAHNYMIIVSILCISLYDV